MPRIATPHYLDINSTHPLDFANPYRYAGELGRISVELDARHVGGTDLDTHLAVEVERFSIHASSPEKADRFNRLALAIALSLPDELPTTEQVPAFEPGGKRCSFIREMCAILDHAANDSRNTLGSAHIKQAGRRR